MSQPDRCSSAHVDPSVQAAAKRNGTTQKVKGNPASGRYRQKMKKYVCRWSGSTINAAGAAGGTANIAYR